MRFGLSFARWAKMPTRGQSAFPRGWRAPRAREDERERDGAVEEVGPAVLARPRGRAADVEHVVEKLEGEADPHAEGAQLGGRTARLERAQLARGAEEGAGLELAAAQVA